MKKKVSELNRDELYEHFKIGIEATVQKVFNGKDNEILEPAVFIGVKKSAMEKMVKDNEAIAEQMNEIDSVRPEGHSDYAIHTALIPLGKFFEDHGHEMVNGLAKKAAMMMVQDAIKQMTKNDMSAVMFTCFVSECYVAKADNVKPEDKISFQLGDKDVIEGIKEGFDSVKDMPGAEETVMLMFETPQSTEMIKYDIMKAGGYKMMAERKSLGKSDLPGQGAITGILHRKDSSFTAN